MYTLLKLNDCLILGISDIDNQHLEIANIINKIIKLLQTQQHDNSQFISIRAKKDESLSRNDNTINNPYHSKPKIGQYLDELIKYTEEHFLYEERLMKKIGYHGLTEHKREHMMLTAELKSYIRDIKSDVEPLDSKSIDSLKSWFVLHIRSSDKALATAFHQTTAK